MDTPKFAPQKSTPKPPSAPKPPPAPKIPDAPESGPRQRKTSKDLLGKHTRQAHADRGEVSGSSKANSGKSEKSKNPAGPRDGGKVREQMDRALDQQLGKGTAADTDKALKGRNDDGTKASLDDRLGAAAKVAGRGAAKATLPEPVAKAASYAIDKYGDKALNATKFARPTAQLSRAAEKGRKMRDEMRGGVGDSRAANRPSAAGPQQPKDSNAGQRSKTDGSRKGGDDKLGGGKGKLGGSGSTTKKVAAGIAAFVVLLLVAVTAFIAEPGDGEDKGAPAQESNLAVEGYIPAGWSEAMQAASNGTKSNPGPERVPWTILAGLAKGQTDFGRYSPYDSEDRDPERDIAPIGPGGSAGTIGSGQSASGSSVNPNAGLAPGSVPEHLVDAVLEAGTKCAEITPALIAAQIEVESQWNPHAVSHAGAQGLTQFMPATWQGYGVDADGDGIKDPFNEYDSVAAQANFDCFLVDTVKRNIENGVYSGDVIELVLASYNAGPNAIARNGGPLTHNAENNAYATKVFEALPKYEGALNAAASDRDDSDDEAAEESGAEPAAEGVAGPVVINDAVDPTDLGAHTAPNHAITRVASCDLDAVEPPIGGESGSQGVGPFLLSPDAAARAEEDGYDPQSPCVSEWIAGELAETAEKVAETADDNDLMWNDEVEWNEDDDESVEQYEQNMKYWEAIINESGLFSAGDGADTAQSCVLTTETSGGDDHKKYASQIAYSFRCVIAQSRKFEVIRGMSPDGDKMSIDYYDERQASELQIIQEALRFSYNWNRWEGLDSCSADDPGPQGLIPLTAAEAEQVGLNPADRCDTGKNAEAAAKLVAEGETISAKERPSDDGPYQPMLGGWNNISAAVGRERDSAEFSARGPGGTPALNDRCLDSVKSFVDDLADSPTGEKFGELAEKTIKPEDREGVLRSGRDFIAESGVEPIATRDGCGNLSDSQYGETLGEYAAVAGGSQDGDDDKKNAYYGIAAWAGTLRTENTKPLEQGRSSYIPRLAPSAYAMDPAPAALADIATMELASAGSQGGNAPVAQQAVEYAVFLGGIVAPFDTAGVLIGSIAEAPTGSVVTGASSSMAPGLSSGGQTTIDSQDCPADDVPIPGQSMEGGSYEFGMSKICQNSVDQARSPEAAIAVKWMLNRVGRVWYSQPQRMAEDKADCSSSISRAYQEGAGLKLYPEGGNAWVTWTFLGTGGPGIPRPDGIIDVPTSELRPGDAYLPHDGHVVMVLSDGFIVHASQDGTPIKVQKFYHGALDAGRAIDPDAFR